MNEPLAEIIADAARRAFLELRETHPETFYYYTLITTEEGFAPSPSAWSWEALERSADGASDPERRKELVKWSYADSPYCLFGEKHFAPVFARYDELPELDDIESDRDYEAALQHRLSEMERAMAMLDREGVFGTGGERRNAVVMAEIVPPERSNIKRAKRLNRRNAMLATWRREAAPV